MSTRCLCNRINQWEVGPCDRCTDEGEQTYGFSCLPCGTSWEKVPSQRWLVTNVQPMFRIFSSCCPDCGDEVEIEVKL